MPYESDYDYPPQMMMPQQARNIPIKESTDFMQWLFNFRDDVIVPLKHSWQGEALDTDGHWRRISSDTKPTMNQEGIGWAISVIQNYVNPVYIISNYDEAFHNWTMRELVSKPIINRLHTSYDRFGLRKIDIPVVAGEMISHINAILLGARGDGYRKFFMSTHHTEEQHMNTNQPQPRRIFGGFGLFKKQVEQHNTEGY